MIPAVTGSDTRGTGHESSLFEDAKREMGVAPFSGSLSGLLFGLFDCLQWLDSYRMSRNELQIVNVKFVVTYPIRQAVQATSVRVSSCVCTIPGGPALAAVVARD